MAEISALVYGCYGSSVIVRASATSTSLPRYITPIRSLICATTARLCAMKRYVRLNCDCNCSQQIEHLRLDRNIQRGNRFVADDQLRIQRQRAGDADALPLPAGELVRIAVGEIRVQPDRLAAVPAPDRAVRRCEPDLGDVERFRDDRPDRHAGVERRGGVLKDHLNIAAVRAQLSA